jgi:hypothetical protein
MATKRWLAPVAVLLAVALLAPGKAQAQTAGPPTAAQALLGTPAATGRFLNLDVPRGEVMATPAERGLLGASAGLHGRLEPDASRSHRSAAESALLGW